MGIQRDSQHEPKGFQSCQFSTAAPLIVETSPVFQHRHNDGVDPLCKHPKIRLWHGYSPWESMRVKVAGAL
jgi:hypothetical protein